MKLLRKLVSLLSIKVYIEDPDIEFAGLDDLEFMKLADELRSAVPMKLARRVA